GGSDAFVFRLNAAGNALDYASYLGGSADDQGNGIAVDAAGTAYLVGGTNSANFPKVNPLQGSLHGVRNAFVVKVSPDGSALSYPTFFGGSGADQGNAVAVDAGGSVFFAGQTTSTDLPLAAACQSSYGRGDSDGFVAHLNAAGTGLVYASYLGGSK